MLTAEEVSALNAKALSSVKHLIEMMSQNLDARHTLAVSRNRLRDARDEIIMECSLDPKLLGPNE
uniref:hypothetical protein n=1 Tax=Janthinobacterium sp. TaxID=1871054 RepID=UPI00293D2E8F